MTKSIPPRLHVLLARESSKAVVIRRGPSKHVCTIGWDRSTDQFHLGQWLKGRIYERRSDLSPDGTHMVYFAMNGKWDSETQGSWTAVSRAPYLKAIGLWAKGDCWNGGGLFSTNEEVVIDQGFKPHGPNIKRLHGIRATLRDSPGAECTQLYYARLERDGWTYKGEEGVPGGKRDIFEKPLCSGWKLRKLAFVGASSVGRGCYWDAHELMDPSLAIVELPDAEWADYDGIRLLWASRGTIRASTFTDSGSWNELCLRDLTDMKLEPIKAPY